MRGPSGKPGDSGWMDGGLGEEAVMFFLRLLKGRTGDRWGLILVNYVKRSEPEFKKWTNSL